MPPRKRNTKCNVDGLLLDVVVGQSAPILMLLNLHHVDVIVKVADVANVLHPREHLVSPWLRTHP